MCARARVCTSQPWSIHEDIAAYAAGRISKLGDSNPLARAGLRMNSNRTTSASSIQYP